MGKRYILIDGSGYIFRAFYALPAMTRGTDKLPVNAVYGFCAMLIRLLQTLGKEDIVVVVFDAARKNFRNDIYPEYKANRLETPPELVPQFAYIRKAVEAFCLPSVEQLGLEADDLIASYSRAAVLEGDEVVVYSSDKDLMQLLSPRVAVYDPLKSRYVTPAIVLEKFGVAPEKVVDVQALIGDSSDNIPGVKGIGPKTAAELIAQYGTLENLLKMAKNIKQDKRREMIEQGADMARISKQLATLKADAELDEPLSSFHRPCFEPARLKTFLDEMEFKSLIPKITTLTGAMPSEPSDDPAPVKVEIRRVEKHYELVQTAEDLEKWCSAARAKGRLAIDTETTGLDALTAQIVGFSMATDEGAACYVPLAHRKKNFVGEGLFDSNDEMLPDQIPLEKAVEILRPLLADPSIKKIGHNIKYDLHIFRRIGLELEGVEDTMVMSYVLDSTRNLHNMDDLARIHLGYKTVEFSEVVKKGEGFADVALAPALDYAAEDADITLRLYNLFSKRLEAEDSRGVYANIDLPIVKVLFDMEEAGVAIDSSALETLSRELEHELTRRQAEVFTLAGREFNILSPKQVGEVLFDELKLPNAKKYSTDVDVLRGLANDGHEIADKILKFREVSKLKNTYADVLPKSRNPRDNRVHTSYFQAGTSTGRLSSSDPNLQNIPIKTDLGGLVRRAFIAAPGKKLLSADYSQIELRILAQIAGVPNLKKAFIDKVDIHARTASEIFGVPLEKITPELRRKAKAVNFGIIYGISPFGLAKNIGVSQTEARSYIDSYFKSFPEIATYMDEAKEFARTRGYVETPFGRKCFIAGINNPKTRGYAERAAINAPIQGGNADIIKIAMRRIYDRLRAQNLDAKIRMLLQVHDELVFEVDDAEVASASALVKKEMEGVVDWSVPIVVDIGVADNWKDAH
ncbi:MAG: DNA polymerase I [Rickettsiales bacterium]|jgi:DNA polymerase-1|nr:DNA polymerase I [Rickettsiales bacterium]